MQAPPRQKPAPHAAMSGNISDQAWAAGVEQMQVDVQQAPMQVQHSDSSSVRTCSSSSSSKGGIAPFRCRAPPSAKKTDTAMMGPPRPVTSHWDPYLSQPINDIQAESPTGPMASQAEVFQLHSALSSMCGSMDSTPQASTSAPVALGPALGVDSTPLANIGMASLEATVEASPAAPTVSYLGEADHHAKPARRRVVTVVPGQSEGSMRGAAPGVGQALPKAAKADANGFKARTTELLGDVAEAAKEVHPPPPQQALHAQAAVVEVAA